MGARRSEVLEEVVRVKVLEAAFFFLRVDDDIVWIITNTRPFTQWFLSDDIAISIHRDFMCILENKQLTQGIPVLI